MGEPADRRVEGLVPIYVNLTHNTFQLQDCFLYRLQAHAPPEPIKVARKMWEELGVPAALERVIATQLNVGLKKYHKKDLCKEHLVEVNLNVELEGRTYKDRVLWDLNEPQNSPDEFAFSVCTDLGLPMSFVDPIRTDVLKQLVEKWKEQREGSLKLIETLQVERGLKRKDDEAELWTPLVKRADKRPKVDVGKSTTTEGQPVERTE
ncbi:hypothetical protein KFL_001410140 [Klebsormidium nitens]|uniref:Uncharacterized protein n=1 Tax=Klebsormidium nitens TaxID=105231 RepID=A0A0U9HLK8_KLENI|nr:hypothetical protein KFL_001410140 [Klebsormidium nitens]|eukprot:GAQ83256.1 hypothetical protein KFL_001410140 [Klebsormidium nitens]